MIKDKNIDYYINRNYKGTDRTKESYLSSLSSKIAFKLKANHIPRLKIPEYKCWIYITHAKTLDVFILGDSSIEGKIEVLEYLLSVRTVDVLNEDPK